VNAGRSTTLSRGIWHRSSKQEKALVPERKYEVAEDVKTSAINSWQSLLSGDLSI
jgi:hypothetical protein